MHFKFCKIYPFHQWTTISAKPETGEICRKPETRKMVNFQQWEVKVSCWGTKNLTWKINNSKTKLCICILWIGKLRKKRAKIRWKGDGGRRNVEVESAKRARGMEGRSEKITSPTSLACFSRSSRFLDTERYGLANIATVEMPQL